MLVQPTVSPVLDFKSVKETGWNHVKIILIMSEKLPLDSQVPQPEAEFQLPEPNPITMARHRREVLVQITLPAVVLLVLMFAAFILAWLASSQEASLWADISIIYLVMVLGILLILVTAVSAGMAYLIIYLNKVLPPYTRLLQDYIGQASRYAQIYSDKAVEPILRTESFSTRMQAYKQILFNRRKTKSS